MTQMRYSLSIGFICSFLCVVMAIAGTRVLSADPADNGEQVQKSDQAINADARPNASMPRIVTTSPKVGVANVPLSTTKITVTFDRDMGAGFSWTGDGVDYPPSPEVKNAYWGDGRTCVFAVELKRGR